MKFENEINKIKQHKKVYFTFLYWDNFSRRLCPWTYSLLNSEEVVEKIIAKLPSILEIDFYEDSDYPYPQVRAHL
jgi:hypothetical protein